jgi:hypothetical protein
MQGANANVDPASRDYGVCHSLQLLPWRIPLGLRLHSFDISDPPVSAAHADLAS